MDIADFLRARFDEELQHAENGRLYAPTTSSNPDWDDIVSVSLPPEVAVRVIADAAVRRNILSAVTVCLLAHRDALGSDDELTPATFLARRVLQALALPYRRHPDFQPEWAQDN